MPSAVEPTLWHWAGFIVCIIAFLALDLGLFNRTPRPIGFREALGWTLLWFVLALGFTALLTVWRGPADALEFVTGYLIELSLSVDNLLVIALVFSYFRVPVPDQHRVLFWGVLGVLVMRGLMIGLGTALVQRFDWILYVMAALLIFTGIKMLAFKSSNVKPDQSLVARTVRLFFNVSPEFDGPRFFTRRAGRLCLTPLFLVLVLIETGDLLFAFDSLPAIFGVTRKAFIVFTSNVFAILGLRSAYFLLADAIRLFRFLKSGISAVLVFIGVKMALAPHGREPRPWQHEIPTSASLMVVAAIITLSILASVLIAPRARSTGRTAPPGA